MMAENRPLKTIVIKKNSLRLLSPDEILSRDLSFNILQNKIPDDVKIKTEDGEQLRVIQRVTSAVKNIQDTSGVVYSKPTIKIVPKLVKSTYSSTNDETTSKEVKSPTKIIQPIPRVVHSSPQNVQFITKIVQPSTDKSQTKIIQPIPKIVRSTPQYLQSATKIIQPIPQIVRSPTKIIHPIPKVVHSSPQIVHNPTKIIQPIPKVVHSSSLVVQTPTKIIQPIPKVVHTTPKYKQVGQETIKTEISTPIPVQPSVTSKPKFMLLRNGVLEEMPENAQILTMASPTTTSTENTDNNAMVKNYFMVHSPELSTAKTATTWRKSRDTPLLNIAPKPKQVVIRDFKVTSSPKLHQPQTKNVEQEVANYETVKKTSKIRVARSALEACNIPVLNSKDGKIQPRRSKKKTTESQSVFVTPVMIKKEDTNTEDVPTYESSALPLKSKKEIPSFVRHVEIDVKEEVVVPHTEERSECSVCNLDFKSEEDKALHMIQEHTYSYECTQCSHHTPNPEAAREHFRISHGELLYEDCSSALETEQVEHDNGNEWVMDEDYVATEVLLSQEKSESSVESQESPVTYECQLCYSTFDEETQYRKHMNKHEKFKLMELQEEQTEGRLYCKDCNLVFTSIQEYNKHILVTRKHKDEKRHILNGCRHCGETFLSPNELNAHITETHPGMKRTRGKYKEPTPCKICGELMESSHRYWAHFRRMHPGEQYPTKSVFKFKCDHCDREFRCKSLLKEHMNKHTGEQVYQCSECPKTFYKSLSLRYHQIAHSEMRPFKCETCGRGFKFKAAVERHQLVHTGERPYVCGVCGQGFTTMHWTKLHVRKVHNNEYIPYKPRVRKRPRRRALTEERTGDQTD